MDTRRMNFVRTVTTRNMYVRNMYVGTNVVWNVLP